MRVNLIEPTLLTDNHLIAELNEINLVAMSFYRSYFAKKGIFEIPDKFTLGKGHVKFFYNKGLYLHNRHKELTAEGIRRGFNIKVLFKLNIFLGVRRSYYNDWVATDDDLLIIKKRITERILQKPLLYRYHRKYINVEKYLNKLNK